MFDDNVQQKIGLAVGFLPFFLGASCFSQTGAFFPTEALTKGSSIFVIGLIVGSFDVSGIVACILPTFLNMENTKNWFYAGAAIRGFSNVCFGLTCYIKNVTVYNIICGVTQASIGVGCFLVWVCGLPYITSLDPSNVAMISGLVQATDALGSIVGPPLGSFLYSWHGFSLPFLVNGVLLFLSALIGFFILKNPMEKEQKHSNPIFEHPLFVETSEPSEPLLSEKVSNSFWNFLKSPKVLISALPFALASSYYGYMSVSLAPYLQETFNICGDTVGYYLLINSATAALASALAGKLTEIGYGVIIYSLVPVMVAFAFFTIFLPLKFPFLVKIIYFVPFLAMSGLSYAAASVTSFLVCEKTALLGKSGDLALVKQYVATLWGLAFCCGRLFGAFVIGGAVLSNLGFYWTNLVLSFVSFTSAVVTFITLAKLKLLRKSFYSAPIMK